VLEKRKVDTASNTAQIKTYTYNAQGLIETEDGSRTDVNDVTNYQYYSTGRVSRVSNALGQALDVLEYDAHGKPGKLKDQNGLVTTLAYDLRGRLISQDVAGEVTLHRYDNAGHLTQTTFPDQTTTSYAYDDAGRLVSEHDHWSNETRYQYDSDSNLIQQAVYSSGGTLQRKKSWSYDATGRLTTEADATGQVTRYSYDKKGNLTGVTDAKNQPVSKVIDALDRPVSTKYPDNSAVSKVYDSQDHLIAVTDALGHTTRYTYNGLGQKTETNSPDTGITRYSYDAAGNLTSEARANGKSLSSQYDVLNRPTRTTYNDGSTITYQYDNCTNGVGRLCSISGTGFSSSWQYDTHGRVVERKESRGLINSVIGYQYNAAGKLAAMTYPSGKVVSYHYNTGRVADVSVNGAVILNQITYNAASQVTGWQWANGSITSRSYDQDGRLVQQSLANVSRSLTYDAVGNILNINDGANQYSYGYDAMSRLLSANNLAYSYDRNGNRLAAESNIYSYDVSSNKLLGVSGSVSRNYQYDATGNALGNGSHSFRYDAQNQLVEVTGVATYLYNGLQQRVAKNANGALSHYAYDENSRLIGEYNATGQAVNETVYLFGQPIAVLKGADVFNVHTDHLGSPRKISNQAGTIVWQWAEKPFGDAPVNQDPDNDGMVFEYNLRFPGQFFDSETGLYYNYHRYYDSQTGRYITSDPIGLAGGWNTYGYVGGNPLGFVDPLGLFDLNEYIHNVLTGKYAKETLDRYNQLLADAARGNPEALNEELINNLALGGSCKFTKEMLSNAETIAKGGAIRKVDELVEEFGGKAKDWIKKKGWDEYGDEWHWYENQGRKEGVKRAGEHDPF
jgi:RHS repeat-associated protein